MDIHRPSTPALTTTQEMSIRSAEIPQSVHRFSERLRHMPLGVWAELAERVNVHLADAHGSREQSATAAARARLREVADEMPGAVVRVRGRVLELISCAEGFLRPEVLGRMKKVALTAAIALAVRPHLAREEFDRLYAPFASAIPVDELAAASPAAGEGESRAFI